MIIGWLKIQTLAKLAGVNVIVRTYTVIMQIAAYQPQVRIGMTSDTEQDRKAMVVVMDVLKIAPAALNQVFLMIA